MVPLSNCNIVDSRPYGVGYHKCKLATRQSVYWLLPPTPPLSEPTLVKSIRSTGVLYAYATDMRGPVDAARK